MTDLYEASQKEIETSWKNDCMILVREERDKALRTTDYIFLPDINVSDEFKNRLITYRQQLRDFPSTWSLEFDNMSESEIYGITRESIIEQIPDKPE